MRHFVLIPFCCVSLFAAPLYAGFVLDDFDDPAEVVSPEMLEDTILTNSVGSLLATRGIRIAATASGQRSPVASLDISGGTMVAALDKAGTTQDGRSALFAFQFNYDFLPSDVAELGLNNAILFDFESIQGSELPLFLRVIVRDATNTRRTYQTHVLDLPLASGPFTAVMPFDSFTIRGGAPGLPDFGMLQAMEFDFFFNRPSLDIQWTARIGRIRFGQIPEPFSFSLLTLGMLCFANFCHRYRWQFTQVEKESFTCVYRTICYWRL